MYKFNYALSYGISASQYVISVQKKELHNDYNITPYIECSIQALIVTQSIVIYHCNVNTSLKRLYDTSNAMCVCCQ